MKKVLRRIKIVCQSLFMNGLTIRRMQVISEKIREKEKNSIISMAGNKRKGSRKQNSDKIKDDNSYRVVKIVEEDSTTEKLKLKSKSEKDSKTSRACQIQPVKGIAREKSELGSLNPFLVDEKDMENVDLVINEVTTATDDYWNKLTNQNGCKTDQISHASDAGTQTDKNAKKNGCSVM